MKLPQTITDPFNPEALTRNDKLILFGERYKPKSGQNKKLFSLSSSEDDENSEDKKDIKKVKNPSWL